MAPATAMATTALDALTFEMLEADGKAAPLRIVPPASDTSNWRMLRGTVKVVDPQTGEERPGLDAAKPLNISGVANAAIVDRVNEMLDPRGVVLTNYLKNPVILADHNYYKPIGTCTKIDVQEDGVHFEAQVGRPDLAPLTQDQIDKRSQIAQGILKTVSVGFIPLEMTPAEFDDAGNLTKPAIYTKWELLEISVVSVPCNADSIFQMKEYAMKGAAGALPMGQTPSTKKDGAPAPGTGQSDEPPMGTAGEMLKAIHECVGQSKDYMVKMHEKMDALHTKVDALKPADPAEPDEDDKDVTQTPSGTEGKPEPIKTLEDRLVKLEANLSKLAEAVGGLVGGLKAKGAL